MFWDNDNQGRLAILAHEFVHYFHEDHYFLEGTPPGEEKALYWVFSLAQYHPEVAILNASNYAYYIMNLNNDRA